MDRMFHFKTRTALVALVTVAFPAGAVVNPWPFQNANGGAVGEPAPVARTNTTPPPIKPAANVSTQRANDNPANANSIAQFLQMLNPQPNGTGGFGSFPGYSGANTGIDGSKYPTVFQTPGSGRLESCGTMNPPSVSKALDQALSFRNGCNVAQRGDNQKIAINDYSADGTPYMYIFNLKGECMAKTAVSYGNGAGAVRPLPCSRSGSNLTPPGMHITAPHLNGQAYNEKNSTLLVGLEGQSSATPRGILIHYAASPGTASSWGCSGVGPYDQVRAMLGYGSLVYNYFGDTSMAPGCGNSAGMGPPKPASCRLDPGATPIPSSATAGPSPDVAR